MLVVAAAVCALFSAASGSFPSWLSYETKTHFEEALQSLDHDRNGEVSFAEVRLGGLGLFNHDELQERTKQRLQSFQTHQFSCVPTLDPNRFVDCLVTSARQVAGDAPFKDAKAHEASIMADTAIAMYLGRCDDVAPEGEEQHCSTLWKSPKVRAHVCAQGACRLSCGTCPESQVFGVAPKGRKEFYKHDALKAPKSMVHFSEHNILIVADPHVEPWYEVDAGQEAGVARFKGASMRNMYECREGEEAAHCKLTGFADPPLTLLESLLSSEAAQKAADYMIVVGDLQAHEFTHGVEADLADTSTANLDAVVKTLLGVVSADRLFIAVGNNDGPHNKIFTTHTEPAKSVSQRWGQALVSHGIVTNALHRSYDGHDAVDFFLRTGYYLKQMPGLRTAQGEDVYVALANSNLGSSCAVQAEAIEADLKFVEERSAKLILVAHHPWIAKELLPSEYWGSDTVAAVISGHTHVLSPTDEHGFATVSAATQYFGVLSSYATAALNEEGKLVITEDNIVSCDAVGVEANSECWKRDSSN